MSSARHDPNDLRDPRLDAAWRATSREEPAPALDDAIRAAARREIGAGPRRADAPAGGVPEALRPERWWWPLAAAATIGAIAIGLLQLAGPDNVTGPASDKAIVSDMPAAPARPMKQEAAPREETPAPAAAPVAPMPSVASGEARDRTAPARPGPSASPALRKDVGAANAPAPARAPPPVAPVEPERQSAEMAKQYPPAAEPFPANAGKLETKEAVPRAELPSTGAVAPLARAPTEPGSHGFAPGVQTAPPKSLPTRRALESTAGRAPAPAAMPDAATDARAKVAPRLPVPDWIALIRRLRDEGRTDEAEKELAAFREAYADHERLLPPDLRDWKPAR
jgi:hypothetical protein